MGENERREQKEGEYGKEECCDLCYCFICQPSLLDSWMRLLHAFFLLASGHHTVIISDLHLQSANSCDLQRRGNSRRPNKK